MQSFRKTEECPSAERLLEFQNGDVDLTAACAIRDHMCGCEFCTAEAAFYSYYPPVDVEFGAHRMPQPLFELAEALLRKKVDLSTLDRLVREPD